MLFDNHIQVRGCIEQIPVLDHVINGHRIFRMTIGVKRDSGVIDHLPVNIGEDTMAKIGSCDRGTEVALIGRVRTRKVYDGDSNRHRDVYIFADRVTRHEEVSNQVTIIGVVRKPPINRVSITNGVEVTELEVEVRRNEHSYFLPIITFKGVAKCAKYVRVGDTVHIIGRLQSRNYLKRLENGVLVDRTAIEVAAWRCTVPPERLRAET